MGEFEVAGDTTPNIYIGYNKHCQKVIEADTNIL